MRKWHRWLSVLFGVFLLWISITGVLSQVGSMVNRGGFETDLEWEEGRLVRAQLRSVAGAPCAIRSAEPVTVTHAGAPVEVELRDGLFCFHTEAGAAYDVTPAGTRPDGGPG